MSKRAEDAALKAYPPETKKAIELLPRDWNKPRRIAFIQGYKQANKETIEKACDILMNYVFEQVTPEMIDNFRKKMEEE